MSNKIVMVSEQYEKGNSGEKVEGITIMIDGILQQFIGVILQRNQVYKTNLDVVQDALMKGLEQIKNEIRM